MILSMLCIRITLKFRIKLLSTTFYIIQIQEI